MSPTVTTCQPQTATNTLFALANPCRVATVLQMNSGMTRVRVVNRRCLHPCVRMRVLMFHAKMERLATMWEIRIVVHALEITVEQIAVISTSFFPIHVLPILVRPYSVTRYIHTKMYMLTSHVRIFHCISTYEMMAIYELIKM